MKSLGKNLMSPQQEMKKHDHIVFGCLLHDIGKFFERAEILDDYRRDDEKQQSYCKKKPEGGYSHFHVLNTLKFCELLSEQVTQIKPDENQRNKAADQHWINLASLHHIPSEREESFLEKIVQAADHLASAEREQGSFYEHAINKKTRLESLLGRVSLEKQARVNDYFLPLTNTSLSEYAIFSKKACLSGMEEKSNDKGKVWLTQTTLVPEYQKIAKQFIDELQGFQAFQSSTDKDKLSRSALRSLLSLMELYLGQVPAATNVLHPDISLFDHLRVTAAIGEGLYLFHETNTDQTDYGDKKTVKWQLVCGDFSGIQKFIYKINSKGAAKALRGRSFFIQLLCDAVAEQILRKLGLYVTARIYSSGGKFYLLIPAHLKEQVKHIADSVNKELLKQFQGDVFLGVGFAEITGDDYREGNMGRRWQVANENLQKQRLQPFKVQVSEEIDCFSQQPQHPLGACKICARDDLNAGINSEKTCNQCKELENIGRFLAETQYLFWAWGEDRRTVESKLQNYLCKIPMPGTECILYFLAERPDFSELTDLSDSHLEVLNEWEGLNKNQQGYSQGIRYVGKWQKEKKSGSWEFDDFANNAKGINRMGVLRMDVDNLGEIFIRGLSFGSGQDKNMGSLSRVVTLSRQLHLFFAGYLHRILNEFQQSQIIYAGGDDVFIIGSWDELPIVAVKISAEFRKYCADNPAFTLSGGISTVGGKYPISRAAELSGDAEDQAKKLRRGNQLKEKDALCFLETAIGWESFADVVALRDTLIAITEKTNSQSIIDRLRQVVIAVDEIKQNEKTGNIQDMIYWNQWRWRLVYNLKRMEKRYPDVREELSDLLNQLITPPSITDRQPVMDWLQLPVRWAEFLTRSKAND
jgi:CRISPR-associated protein Csm1